MRGILVAVLSLVLFGSTAFLLWFRERKHIDKISGEIDSYYSVLKEKRRTIRLNRRLNAVCKVTEKPNSQWSAFSKDISGEGVCLNLPEILPQDAIVDIEVDIPGGTHIAARGSVVWVKEAEASASEGKRLFNSGIKFIKISQKNKEALANFIEASLKSES